MELDQVEALIGGAGTLLSESGEGISTFLRYQWDGTNPGSNAVIVFEYQGVEPWVIGKSQAGLE